LSNLHYLPLSLPFFSILVGIFVGLVALVEFGVLSYTYTRIGLRPRPALWQLFASLLGSYFNIPVARLPGEQILTTQAVNFFGVDYAVPAVVDWPGTVIAVIVGGALVPGVVSLYLLIKYRLWVRGLVATACVTAVCHVLAHPVPGLGIALPTIVPALTAAIAAAALSRTRATPLAYVCGSLGTLIGADLLNLGALRGLGAPVASIGGAGTFDGIFLVGVLAVVFTNLYRGADTNPGGRRRIPV
jgi:uncharacterized membrane protein